MLLFNRKLKAIRKFKSGPVALALCLGLGLALSGCQVRPLYSGTTMSGQTLSADLSSIEIVPAKSRLEQELRNNLIFAFNGGAEQGIPAYRLDMKVTSSTSDLDIESGTGLAKTSRTRLTVTYQLIRLADKEVATTGSSFFTASFAQSTQRYANERALLDAENRVAEQVANDIHLRLSAFFAAGT
ncbi:LPS assembly lipoprotein LptE [Cohaesibacter celericrescens]|nr:LPS assembly lipoprotein LptE [Cohaesibacter celericrescens]